MHAVCKMALHDLGCLEGCNIAHSTSSHGFASELLQVDVDSGAAAAAAVMGCCCACAVEVEKRKEKTACFGFDGFTVDIKA